MIEFIGTWTRDQLAYDPSAKVRTVDVDGHLFTVHNVLGPGWPMTVRPAGEFTIHTVGWEDWAEVERAAREHLAKR